MTITSDRIRTASREDSSAISILSNSAPILVLKSQRNIITCKSRLESALNISQVKWFAIRCTNRRKSKGLFTWRWGTPGRWGNSLRWGNPPVHITSHFSLIRLHDRWGDPARVTSPTWGPPPPCKQALTIQKAYSEEAQGKPPGL